MKTNMKRLLIIQSYNANKGNSSVIHAMKRTLLAGWPDLHIALTAYDPNKAEQEYGLESSDWLVDLRRIKLAKAKGRKGLYMAREGLWILYSMFWLIVSRMGLHLPVPRFKKKTIQLYLRSNVVTLPGGHLFTNLNSFITNLSHFYGLFFAIALKKRCMVYAETIGPFFGIWGPISFLLTRFLLKRVDIVTVRDRNSLEYCQGLKNSYMTAECVFALETDQSLADYLPDAVRVESSGRLLVGVTVHHLYYRRFFSHADYVALMAAIFDRIIKDFDAEILVIPMEDSYHGGGDRPIIREMIGAMKEAQHIHVLEGDHDCIFTSSVLARVDIFIGTKTHSIVYGLKSSVPTISISYHDKANEFMEMFGMLDHAINLKELTVEGLMRIFRKVVQNRAQIRVFQQKALDRVRRDALENNRLLMTLFE